jgi:large subunit ribosomal protein L54
MTKKQRAKYERKQERIRQSLPAQIPLHEQSTDLTAPGASAQESLAKRQALTKSQRDARRKSIRESNFLKAM